MKKRSPLVIILVVIAALCLAGLGVYFVLQGQRQDQYKKLSEVAFSGAAEDLDDLEMPTRAEKETGAKDADTEETAEEIEYADIPIDWDVLAGVNEDIYAWIYIDGTAIDFPVVQHPEDDLFYLDHTVYKESGYPGAVFTQGSYNGKDLDDFNTVIYAHNTLFGNLFGELHNYEDPAYMKAHSEILICNKERLHRYRIFAAVRTSNKHLLEAYNFAEESGRESFIALLGGTDYAGDVIDTDIEVGPDDRFLTLSTCVKNDLGHRWIIVGVLEEELFTKEAADARKIN